MLKKAFSLVLGAALAVGLAVPAMASEYGDVRLRDIRLSNHSIRLEEDGEPMRLTVTYTPYGAFEEVEWSSSDEDVVTVDSSGLVSPVNGGDALISVETESGERDTCRVEVRDAEGHYDRITRVEMNFDELTVRLGQTRQLMASLMPRGLDEEDKYLRWESDDRDVAEVDPDGTVHGIGLGTTTITV
jgi:uncharacterized protein YjdB